MTRLRAVTFDFWRTLMWEPLGELERVRLEHWVRLLSSDPVPADPSALSAAHAAAFGQASASWRRNVQFRAEDAVTVMLEYLRLDVPDQRRAELTRAFSLAGAETPLELAPGIEAALRALRQHGIRIGIVCDVGLTPSPVLREHLARRQLLECFDHWSFSDETGQYKPSAAPFLHACAGLGVEPHEAAHVGDQRRTDVVGAESAGMLSVRYTGIFDDPDGSWPSGQVLVGDHADLPHTLLHDVGSQPTDHSNGATSG